MLSLAVHDYVDWKIGAIVLHCICSYFRMSLPLCRFSAFARYVPCSVKDAYILGQVTISIIDELWNRVPVYYATTGAFVSHASQSPARIE
jgi:hypothetical protein